jgi:predicted DNA-binding protein
MGPKVKIISFRVDSALHSRLVAEAERQRRDVAWIIREILEQHCQAPGAKSATA